MVRLSSERQALYKVTEVERFLSSLITGDSVIEPVFDLEFGYRYPTAEKAMNKEPDEAKKLLETIAEAGILDRKLYTMELKCPNCGSSNVSTNYICPFCGSIDIAKNALIEHISCGYIDVLTNFEKNGTLVCPKCHNKLEANKYRSVGNWYACENCGKRIEHPLPSHSCRRCDASFTLDDTKYNKVYSYTLASIAREEISRGIFLIDSIKDNLTKLGYTVKTPFVSKGNSGVEHTFDLSLENNAQNVFIDILTSDKPVPQVEIIKEYVKMLDVKVDLYIIVIPKLDDEARRLAVSYKVKFVEAYSPQEAVKTIIELFEPTKQALKSKISN